jgi:hypothetical protein
MRRDLKLKPTEIHLPKLKSVTLIEHPHKGMTVKTNIFSAHNGRTYCVSIAQPKLRVNREEKAFTESEFRGFFSEEVTLLKIIQGIGSLELWGQGGFLSRSIIGTLNI